MHRAGQLLLALLVIALVAFIFGVYVYFVGFGIVCNGRSTAEYRIPLIVECWFERKK